MPRCYRRIQSQRIMNSIEREISRNAEIARSRKIVPKPAPEIEPADTRDPIEMARAAAQALHPEP
jgi:hypothetical protein